MPARKKASKRSAKRKPKAATARRATARRASARKKAVPPPPGWTAVKNYPAPKRKRKRSNPSTIRVPAHLDFLHEHTLEERVRDFVDVEVKGGFSSDAEILEKAIGVDEPELEHEVRRVAPAMIAAARHAHAEVQKRWPKVTDNDRLDAAFAELESRGILARQNYWCCGTCGCAAIDDEMAKLRRRKRPARGYAFFHNQDTECAVLGGGLYLNYGADSLDDVERVQIGKEIAKVLRSHKFRVIWNGELDTRILVRFKWARRRD